MALEVIRLGAEAGDEDQRGPCIWARGEKPHSPEKNAGWPGRADARQTTCPQEFLTFRTAALPARSAPGSGSVGLGPSPWRLRQTSLEEREGPRVCQDCALGLEHPAGRAAPGLDGMGAAAACAERGGSGQQGLWGAPTRPRLQLRCGRPWRFWPGTPGGTSRNGPRVPCPGSGEVSLRSAQGSPMVHPPPVAGMGPPGPGLCPWRVKALAERRLCATRGSGRGDVPPWKDAGHGAPARSVWGRCWPPSGTIFASCWPPPRELCSREGGTGPGTGLGGRLSASSQL